MENPMSCCINDCDSLSIMYLIEHCKPLSLGLFTIIQCRSSKASSQTNDLHQIKYHIFLLFCFVYIKQISTNNELLLFFWAFCSHYKFYIIKFSFVCIVWVDFYKKWVNKTYNLPLQGETGRNVCEIAFLIVLRGHMRFSRISDWLFKIICHLILFLNNSFCFGLTAFSK